MTMPGKVEGNAIVCVHEDRKDCLTGVKLAILGLEKCAPGLRAAIHCPGAPPEFAEWLSDRPHAELVALELPSSGGWNVKPSILLKLLESHSQVVWLDSDILVTGALIDELTDEAPGVLVATEETFWGQQQGGTFRTQAWGLRPGREMQSTVNSGVLRVTREHVPLLLAWQKMLAHPVYLKAQAGPWYERPLHMIGDQEVLTGLLGAVQFADVPLRLLRRGVDIAQCFGPAGFTPGERVRAWRKGVPPLIHAMGMKPWKRGPVAPSLLRSRQPLGKSLRDYYDYLALDVAPYGIAARVHAPAMREDTSWMFPRSMPGKLLQALMADSVCLSGLPVALFDHSVRFLRRKLNVGRFSANSADALTEPPF